MNRKEVSIRIPLTCLHSMSMLPIPESYFEPRAYYEEENEDSLRPCSSQANHSMENRGRWALLHEKIKTRSQSPPNRPLPWSDDECNDAIYSF